VTAEDMWAGMPELEDGWSMPVRPETDTAGPPISVERFPRIDWQELFANPEAARADWLPGRLCERGQQIALVSDGKAGKTLLVHEWAWRAVTGRPFLGDERRDPIRVQYWDRENSRRDILGRFLAFGATADDLDLLDYRPFPQFTGPLDAAPAAEELLYLVDQGKPDVVVLDTASRYIGGKESDSDTWLALHRLVHGPLKARGIAGWRLDHFGKDADRGSRGSSAKSQDVDHVWELSVIRHDSQRDHATGTTTVVTELKLKRTHTRTGLGEDAFHITRRGRKGETWLRGDTRHELTAADSTDGLPGDIRFVLHKLDELKIPRTWGRDRVRQRLIDAHVQVGNDLLGAALKARKAAE
jgi:hypothetical protein